MGTQISFSQLENELAHDYRNKLNISEDGVDVHNNFSQTATNFLSEAIKDKIELNIEDDDIIFVPENEEGYKFSKKISSSEELQELIEDTDISNIIERFAESAKHRYTRLKKHKRKPTVK